ncbi:Uncharacterised protein [Chlamydia trachomatis]|nr:Uncharacterised protein [Chlamydia trachomatis]
MKSEEGIRSPRARVTGCHELPDLGAGSLNSGPLQEWYTLLTAEPSLQSHKHLHVFLTGIHASAYGAREMAQQLRACTTLAEDLSSSSQHPSQAAHDNP